VLYFHQEAGLRPGSVAKSEAPTDRAFDNNHNITDILLQWENSEAVCAELVQQEKPAQALAAIANFANDSQPPMGEQLVSEQSAILSTLVSSSARTLQEVRAKLKVWIDLNCPSPGDMAFLSVADRLVVSVYDDLCRLAD
jgi:hypothetical protein